MNAIQIMTAHIHVAARTADMRNCTCNQWHSFSVSCAEFRAYVADMEREQAMMDRLFPSRPDTAKQED